MEARINELLECYSNIGKRIKIIDGNIKYANLVTANGNQGYPIQRWFHLKEAFSIELLPTLIDDWHIPLESIDRVLDPFCGIGTTLMSVQMLAKKIHRDNLEAIGIECNPFLHFVAQTKIKWSMYDPIKLKLHIDSILNKKFKANPINSPALSTLHRREIYDPRVLNQSLRVRNVIKSISQEERAPLLLGYASVLESISGVRKDGRALRIEPNKQRLGLKEALNLSYSNILNDISVAKNYFEPIKSYALLGDGRTLNTHNSEPYSLGNIDLIMYSPPYLNNIDYTEVYKIELWMCGFINTYEEFRELRHRTVRSHPSVRFKNPITIMKDVRMKKVVDVLDILIQALPKDDNLSRRTAFFWGYFDDMYISLKHQIDVLRSGGWIFCVVGNSLHGPMNDPNMRVPVASDLIIALIAEALDLEVKAIQVARYLKRRSPHNNLLRESILIFQKR